MTHTLVIVREPADGAVARALIAELNEAIWGRYPEMRPVDGEAYREGNFLASDTPFFVAYLDGRPVGCGAFRPLGRETAEIKRMFVRAPDRRRGVGRAILRRLEGAALEAGYAIVRLETGSAQTEAIALYEREGYRQVPCWPPYDALPISLCMEKTLADPLPDRDPAPGARGGVAGGSAS